MDKIRALAAKYDLKIIEDSAQAHGAIVGAGSVVTKDVESNTIVVGNPAKFLKKLPI